jgi:hypothetical protein
MRHHHRWCALLRRRDRLLPLYEGQGHRMLRGVNSRGGLHRLSWMREAEQSRGHRVRTALPQPNELASVLARCPASTAASDLQRT